MKNEQDRELIDQLLNDEEFRCIVQDDIGAVSKVEVDWKLNEIRFYGAKYTATVDLRVTIAILKNQMH